MSDAGDWAQQGQTAHNEGRLDDALACYERAVTLHEEAGRAAQAAHARRHCADLQLNLGRGEDAARSIAVVLANYAANEPAKLELANTLRIAAPADEATGALASARRRWAEALALYEAVDVPAGAQECRRRLFEHPER